MPRTRVSGPGQKRVSAKISHLVKEGEPQKKAVAMALNMEREHRLTKGGGYKKKGGRSETRRTQR